MAKKKERKTKPSVEVNNLQDSEQEDMTYGSE